MRKIGGFFIGMSFLILSCATAEDENKNKVFGTALQNDRVDVAKEDIAGVNDEGFFENDLSREGQQDFQGINYVNNDLRIKFFYPENWRMIEGNNFGQGLIFVLGNFAIDDLFHPKNGEILVEGLRFFNDEGKSLEDWARDYRRSFNTERVVVFEQNENFIRLVVEFGEMPNDWEGDWLSGFSEEYCWQRSNEIFVFKAVVNVDDTAFLIEFGRMMESFSFNEEEENER